MDKLIWTQEGNVTKAVGSKGTYLIRPFVGDYVTEYPLRIVHADGRNEAIGPMYPSLEDAKSHADAHAADGEV